MLETALICVVVLGVLLLGVFDMGAVFRSGITPVFLVGRSGGGLLWGASSSGSELANSGGGGMKEMASKPLYCPAVDGGDGMLEEFLF